MDQGAMSGLASLDGCIGWLTAVALIVVGLLPVRKVYATAGYLIAGGGLLRWAFFCCESLPTALLQAEQYELYDTLGVFPSLLGLLFWLLSTGAVLAGFVVLARHAKTRLAEAGGAA
ncbi:MAG: hypothetical protein VYE22_09440 [Myxococcota bacterium]|nr:hypothetical protein [Myxococcota bacterium]